MADSLSGLRPALGSTLIVGCDGGATETIEPAAGSYHAGGRTGESGSASAQCGRCGHEKSRHGGMPGPELGATERNNASRCGACEEADVYCERWTPSYGPFPGGPPAPAAEEWVEALTPMLVEERAAHDATKRELAEVRAALRAAQLKALLLAFLREYSPGAWDALKELVEREALTSAARALTPEASR